MLNKDKLIYLGYISKAHGIQGNICIKSLTANPADIVKMPLQDKNGRIFSMKLISAKPEFLICSVREAPDRNSAELLKGTKLYTLRSSMPELDETEHYIEDIKGLEVRDQTGAGIGKVLGVHNFGAGDIIEVVFNDGKSEMYPFTNEFFPVVTKMYVEFVAT
jgi:16S rRNA processing protein RimM